MTAAKVTFTPGDVVRYDPKRSDRWCIEGMALADRRGLLIDTYWEFGNESHVLTEAELLTVRPLFNVNDYRELARHEHRKWQDYHPDQRQVITAQHGLSRRLFVLIGSEPDLGTRIENAREAVRDAEGAVDSAQRKLAWRRADLAQLTEATL